MIYNIHIIRRGQKKLPQPKARINRGIRAPKVRLLGDNGENFGVISTKEALKKAEEAGLDLVEVTAKADPPVAKITNYGKYQYEQNKLKKEWAKKDKEKGSKQEDTKSVQIKPGTGKDMLEHRAGKIKEWLEAGHKVHIDLFLFGRYKGMDEKLHKERLSNFLDSIQTDFEMIDEIKKSPKGYSVNIQVKKK